MPIWDQIWQNLEPMVIPMIGVALWYVRALLKTHVEHMRLQVQALTQTVIEKTGKSEMELKKENSFLEMVNGNARAVEKAREKIDDLVEKNFALQRKEEELQNEVAIMRTERDEQLRELKQLNEKIEGLQKKATDYEGERTTLLNKIQEEQDARQRAEQARDLAQEAHNLERERWQLDLNSLQSQVNDLRTQQQATETKMNQTQEEGIPNA